MMKNTEKKQWRRLYDAAIAVREMAPWQWMLEGHIFGVQNPETQEIGFASVMGTLGEHLAISAYMGAQNIHGFWQILRHRDEKNDPQSLLEMYHLQTSFEDRKFLDSKDRQILKTLGLKFRGQQAYPLFRSYRPAQFPWFLNTEERAMLTVVLEQVLEMAPRLKKNPNLFERYDAEHFLVRVQTEQGWVDQDMYIPAPPPEPIPVELDESLLKTFNMLPKSRLDIDLDLFLTRNPTVDENNDRPFFPYALLLLDPKQDKIITMDLQMPFPSLNQMYGQVPMAIVRQLAGIGLRPRRIRVSSRKLFTLLKPLDKSLGFGIQYTPNLPILEQAKASFHQFAKGQRNSFNG